jgi:hypothetical protein
MPKVQRPILSAALVLKAESNKHILIDLLHLTDPEYAKIESSKTSLAQRKSVFTTLGVSPTEVSREFK